MLLLTCIQEKALFSELFDEEKPVAPLALEPRFDTSSFLIKIKRFP